MKKRILRPRTLLLVLLLLILAVATYGFAAQNTVPDSYAGDGSAGVSGYQVTGVHYVLNTTNPSQIASVQFKLQDANGNTVAASSVYAGVSSDNTNWSWSSSCSEDSTTHVWNCPLSAPVLNINYLRVVASN